MKDTWQKSDRKEITKLEEKARVRGTKEKRWSEKKESKGSSLVQRGLSQCVKPYLESSVAATVQALTLLIVLQLYPTMQQTQLYQQLVTLIQEIFFDCHNITTLRIKIIRVGQERSRWHCIIDSGKRSQRTNVEGNTKASIHFPSSLNTFILV